MATGANTQSFREWLTVFHIYVSDVTTVLTTGNSHKNKWNFKEEKKKIIPQGRIELPTFALLNTAYKYDALTDYATGEFVN